MSIWSPILHFYFIMRYNKLTLLPDVTSLVLRYTGAPSVCPAVDGHTCFSGYSDHLASASWHPGTYCFHHTAPDLLCRPGAHIAPARGFQRKCVESLVNMRTDMMYSVRFYTCFVAK